MLSPDSLKKIAPPDPKGTEYSATDLSSVLTAFGKPAKWSLTTEELSPEGTEGMISGSMDNGGRITPFPSAWSRKPDAGVSFLRVRGTAQNEKEEMTGGQSH